jgi:CheY-like chemotaxis protein
MDILLKKLGYEPVLMTDVAQAIEMVRQNPPSLVLLDIMMTPMNGWEFLEKIRQEFGIKDLPVILFTASPSVDEKIADLNDPRLGILRKPVSMTDLKEGLEKFLGT